MRIQYRLFFKIGLWLLFTVFSVTTSGQNTGYVKGGDLNIYYRDYGEGIPIVLLSGGPGQSSNALLPIVERLKDQYRLILIDQRGTGKSNLEIIDSSSITLDKYVEDINDVRKFLKLKDWVVMGHSWGGGLAMALTAKYPEHTSKLILIGSIGIDTSFMNYALDNLPYSKEDVENIEFWSDPEVIAINPERAAYEFYSSLLATRVYDQSVKREILKNFVAEPNTFEIAPLMFKHLKSIGYDLKPPLKKFNNPTLIIQGRQGFLGGWTAFNIYQTLPNCEIKFIEKCGHFPFIERPDDFYEALETFLE
jgi:proline iminopeptidase